MTENLSRAEAREWKTHEALDKARRSELSLRERIKEWEGYYDRQQSQACHDDEQFAQNNDHDRDREQLALRVARAQADGRSALGSSSSEVPEREGGHKGARER